MGTKFSGIGLTSRDCLARAMYFESNRSSDDGMLAVGTVVMNRYESGKYGKTVCEVVGAPRQFAPGVLSRSMEEGKSKARAYAAADRVLRGARHPTVGKAEFFHTAGYQPGYNNMRYVSIEGGNAFYEKVKKGEDTGDLVRLARNGPAQIGDIITIQERTALAHKPFEVPPPMDGGPVYAPPASARMAQPRKDAPPARRVATGYTAAPPPPPPSGWTVGPPGRIY
jgi:hypothetical protein